MRAPRLTGLLLLVVSVGTLRAQTTGYGVLTPQLGQPSPAATVVYSLVQNGVLVSEAGVPSVQPTTKARVFVDVNPPSLNTGLAIANSK